MLGSRELVPHFTGGIANGGFVAGAECGAHLKHSGSVPGSRWQADPRGRSTANHRPESWRGLPRSRLEAATLANCSCKNHPSDCEQRRDGDGGGEQNPPQQRDRAGLSSFSASFISVPPDIRHCRPARDIVVSILVAVRDRQITALGDRDRAAEAHLLGGDGDATRQRSSSVAAVARS